ncbi:FadR/GntR family transcriptional regulator [Wukongibacter baidiensis]|uniref:FadR/GntR family transcriptional regulator n=1 Tax=Wukongibacter baidiensis TaxID=1723361 RepID=UPI003D7F9C74
MTNSLGSTPFNIAEYIKKEINEGRLKPGDKLPSERELVKTLGVSRSSVREAIKSLTTMGYLEPIKRRGTFISEKYKENKYANSQLNSILNRAPIFDLMEVRMFLEEKFISLAVNRCTDEDIERLNAALEKMKMPSEDINNFFLGDMDFHFALAEATHNIVIIELMKVIKKRIYDDKEQFKAAGIETREKTIEAFEKIIHHIKEKNVAEAELLYHNHIYLVESFFKKSLNGEEYD